MATINLGAIKFNWQGAYNNSTSYVADDVVSSGGNSYVCILASTGNAVSNGTYWSLMAQAGTNGTTVGLGTAGQVLKTNSGASAIEWGNEAGGAWSVKSSGTATNVAAFNITGLTKTTQVFLSNTFPVTEGTQSIYSRVSQDNGSSWISSGYRFQMQWARDDNNSNAASGSGTSGSTFIRMGMIDGNVGGENNSWIYTIHSPANTSRYTTMSFVGTVIEYDANSLCTSVQGSAYYSGNTNAINGLQFYYPSGNITTDYIVLELN